MVVVGSATAIVLCPVVKPVEMRSEHGDVLAHVTAKVGPRHALLIDPGKQEVELAARRALVAVERGTRAGVEAIELGTTIRSGAADPAFERASLGYRDAVHLIDLRSEETLWSIEVEGVANQLFDPTGQRIVMVRRGRSAMASVDQFVPR